MTIAEQDAALAGELEQILVGYINRIPAPLVAELVGVMSGYAARQVERHARGHYPWPPPRRLRVDEAHAAAREARKPA